MRRADDTLAIAIAIIDRATIDCTTRLEFWQNEAKMVNVFKGDIRS
jgi:hypothetical protein